MTLAARPDPGRPGREKESSLMQLCPKCSKTYETEQTFCTCGERLTTTADANVIRELTAEVQRIRTDVFDRLEALEEGRDQAGIAAQRIQTADTSGLLPREMPASELRQLDRSSCGFADFGEFVKIIGANPADGRLQALNTRALSAGTGSAGGFLIPSEWSDALVDAIAYASIVRPYARYAPRSAEHPDAEIEMPMLDYSAGRFGGVNVGWIGEGAAKPEHEPVFRSLKLKPIELAGHCEVTDKLLRNAPGAASLLAGLFAQAIAATMDDAYLSGNGVAQPLGVLNHPACINVPRAGPGAVAYGDLVDMVAASRGTRKRWLISQTVIAQIANATLAGGLTSLWQPLASSWGSVLGYPVDVWEAAPVLGTLGDVLLVDWSYYLVKDGCQLAVDVTNSHGTNFVENRSVLKAFAATDGQPWLNAPITLADGVTQVSPFVALL